MCDFLLMTSAMMVLGLEVCRTETDGTYWDPQYLLGPTVPIGTYSTYWDPLYLLGPTVNIGTYSTCWDLQ